MNLYNLLKKIGFLLLLVTLVTFTANAQGLSTVYLDVTNGSDAYSGLNAVNNPANTGPKATFDGALGAVANNGTIIVMGGTYNGGDGAGAAIVITTANYANLVASGSLTIEARVLAGNKQVDLSAGAFTYDIDGGTLNFTSTNGDEYMSTAAAVTLGSNGRSVTVNSTNSSFFRMATGQTLTIWDTSTFATTAPQKGTDLDLTFRGAGDVNAGVANYADFGAGDIDVDKTSGTVTFPNAITKVASITLTEGSATFTAAVTVDGTAAGNDVVNNNIGTLTFAALNLNSDAGATADANLVALENLSTGTITVNGITTVTFADGGGARVFADGNDTRLFDNRVAGTYTLGAIALVTTDASAARNITVVAKNITTGTMTLGTITADESTPDNSNIVILSVTTAATAGTVNLAGGNIRGALTVAGTHTANINGATTVGAALINAGTTVLGANTLTLSGNSAHLTNGGTVTATSGGIVVSATGASSFNGGTLSNVTINGVGGTCTFATNAIAVTNFTVTNGTAKIDEDVTASGATLINGGTLDINAKTFTTGAFTQTSGTVDLSANAASILDVNGDFSRTTGTFTANAASDVIFSGTAAQSVSGGSLWTVADLAFTNTAGTVTLNQSVRATGAVSISANANLALGTLNIILFANNASIDNDGAYTATGGGGIIFGGVNTISGAASDYTGQTIAGTGTYSFLLIDVGTDNTVTTANNTDNIKWSGRLELKSGDLTVAANDDLAPTGASAEIIRNLVVLTGSLNGIIATAGTFNVNVPTDYNLTYNGTLANDRYVPADVSEFDVDRVVNLTINTITNKVIITSLADLTVKGNLTLAASSLLEFRTDEADDNVVSFTNPATLVITDGAKFNDGDLITVAGTNNAANDGEYLVTNVAGATLTVTATDGGGDVVTNGVAAGTAAIDPFDATLNGTLTVPKGAVITGGNAANKITLDGNTKTHTVLGSVTALSPITVSGSGSALNGDADATNENTITDLLFEPAADGASFTSTNLEVIDDLTLQGTSVKTGATVTITMNATDGALATLVMGNGTLGPTASVTINGTAATHTGVLTLTDGSLTYTRNGAAAGTSTIGGAVTLTKGTLTLGSNVTVTGATAQVAANIDLGGFKYTQLGGVNYVRSGAGTLTNGTLSLDATAGNITLTPGTTFQLPNVEFVGGGNAVSIGASLEITGTLLFDNAGTVAQTGVLTVSGGTITVTSDAGAFTGAMTITGTDVTLGKNYAIPTLVINSNGTVTVASDPAATVFTLTSATFTLTKGILAMGINHLAVATAFTYTAGSITQGTGFLKLNVAVPSFGTGFSIDNLELTGDMSVAGAKEKFTVNKNLLLSGGSVTTDADGDLTLGDGVLIERQDNTETLVKLPTFGANTDLKYSTYAGGADIAIALEAPATIRNLTVEAGGAEVTLADNKTITGTLSLDDRLDVVAADPDAVITMADGSTLELKVDGTVALDANLTLAGTMNLVYNGASNTTTRELGPITNGAYATYSGDVTFESTVALAENATFTGTLTFSGASNLTTTAQTVDVQGNVVQLAAATGFFAGTGTVTFSGATNTNITLVGNEVIVADMTFELNKTNNNNTVTLAGANLDFRRGTESDGNVNIIKLTKGVLVTGTNLIILEQDEANGNVPEQGFTRTSGVIFGNVKKFIAAGQPVDISRVEFPTGDVDGNYRAAAIFFKTAPQSSLSLTVNQVSSSPGGTNGIPLNTGTLTITNYPDFYWYIKSDQALAPSYQYDMELQAQGYTDYQTDGIQNIRMLRRDSGDVDNQWVMQGADNAYDNSTINASFPVLKVIDAQGGITTQGSKFTFSQNNKAPVFTAAFVDTTIAEGDSVSFTYTATDADIGQTPTLSAVTMPTGATFDAGTGVFNWVTTSADSGTHTVTIRASDGVENTDTTITITVTNVNQNPVFVNVPSDTTSVAEGTVFNFTITASDPDGTTSFTYSLVAAADSVSIVDSTGALSFNPSFADSGNVIDYTVRVADGDGGTADTALTFVVTNTNRAPVFDTAMADTSVDEAATLTLDFGANSSDPDGNALTYTFTLTLGGTAAADSGAIVSGTGVYTWTPLYTQAGVYELIVTVSDGTLSAADTVAVTVNNQNAAPTWASGGELTDQTVSVGDTLNFTYMAEDLDNDAITYAFVGNTPSSASLNASTGVFSWAPATATQFPVVITVSATDSIATAIQTSATVTVNESSISVSGTVTYENIGNTPIIGAVVTLWEGTTLVATDTTIAGGAYSFAGVIGFKTYTVKVSKTGGWPSSAVLASDALLAARSSVDTTVVLTALQTLAADVTGNGNVTAGDALQILRRVVGQITSFTIADWQFESKTQAVAGTNTTVNLKGIAAGDVNASATTLPKKSKVTVISGKNINISLNSNFELPVRINAAQAVGAFTLRFTYPVQMMTFKSVKSNVGIISYAKDNKISIAWAQMPGERSLKDGETPTMVFVFKATKAFARSTSAGLTLDNGEIVNVFGKNMADASVNMSQAEVAIPLTFALSQNYPNPFNPSTIIEYQLPVKGNVTLTIYNTLGQRVVTLIDNQEVEAGSYKTRWNAKNLASGIYFYSLRVEGIKGFLKTRKMILLK